MTLPRLSVWGVALLLQVLVWASLAAKLPTVRTVEQRLDDEVNKMISAGHLRPGYYVANEKWFFQMVQTYQYVLPTGHEYWSNPAETIYTLVRALPHVSNRQELEQYIQDEWNACPPSQYTHCGWSGARREHFEFQTDKQSQHYYGASTHGTPGTYDSVNYPGFRFNPFNLYACWLYAQEFGTAVDILDQVRNKVQAVPEPFADTRPFLLNMYLAGYVGYLGLQELVGESPRADVEAWLARGLELRISAESTPLVDQPGVEFGGYMYLVPEVAERLRPALENQIASRIQDYESAAPYWFAAKIDEVNRFTTPSHDVLDEGATSLYYSYWSPFNAKAFILQEDRAELERYLDVPGVWRGDLYYIQNLVSTIEANRVTRRPVGVPGRRTPTRGPGSR